jgi:hypothetical protein
MFLFLLHYFFNVFWAYLILLEVIFKSLACLEDIVN